MKHIGEVFPKQPSICNCMNIRRASLAVTQFYDGVVKPSGLTISQLGLLRHVEMLEQITISELAKIIRIDRTTLNRNMKPLAEAGLITVSPGADSRTRQVRVTDAGRSAAAKGWKLWQEAQESLKQYLGDAELEKLVQLLSKLEALSP
jgi:DNA-binding MarR family transcriptional regulator